MDPVDCPCPKCHAPNSLQGFLFSDGQVLVSGWRCLFCGKQLYRGLSEPLLAHHRPERPVTA